MNKTVKYLIFAGLWSVLLIPFLVFTDTFFPYITGKNFAFRIIVEIIFALWIYLAYVDVKYRPKFSWIAGTFGIFVALMAVADFFAMAPFKAFFSNYERMDGWITLIHLLMYLLVFGSMMKTEKMWLWFFRSSIVISMIMVAFAAKEWLSTGTSRVSITLGNPIYVAVYFLFNFFFALILLYKDVILKIGDSLRNIFRNKLTYLYLIVIFLCGFGIWRTSTRGVILGLLGGLVITTIFISIFEKNNKAIRKLSVCALAVLVVLIGGFFAVKNTQFVKNNVTLSRLAAISWENVQGQGQARQYVWPMALEGFKEKPIFGWGQEGFNYVFNKYYDPRMYNQEQWFDRAHNTPLDVLIAGGALGLLSYLSIFLFAVYIVWKRKEVFDTVDAGLLIGLLAAYFAQNLFVFDNLVSYMFFLVVLSYIYSKDAESRETLKPTDKKQRMGISEDMANYVVAPIVAVTAVVCLWYFNVRPLQANLTLIKAIRSYDEGPSKNLEYFKKAISYNTLGLPEIREQLINITPKIAASTGVDVSIKQEFADFTYEQMLEQLKQTPKDARYQFFMGTFLNNMRQYQMSVPFLEEAVNLSPNKQTMMFELAEAYGYTNQKQKALEIAKKAYELEPDFVDAKYNYIAAAILNKNDVLAKELLGGDSTANSEVIIRAYLMLGQEYLDKGDKYSAIAEVRKAIKIAPTFEEQGNQIIENILSGKM